MTGSRNIQVRIAAGLLERGRTIDEQLHRFTRYEAREANVTDLPVTFNFDNTQTVGRGVSSVVDPEREIGL